MIDYYCTYSGHCDNRPPEAFRNRVELIMRIVLNSLGVEDERRKDDDADDEEKN